MRLNITAKLLGYLLLAGMLPVVVLGFSALNIARGVVLEQAQAENVHLMGSFASYLRLYDDQIEDLATNIAGNDAIGQALRSADNPTHSSYDALNLRAQIGYALNNYIRVKGLVSLDLFSLGGNHFHVGETLNIDPQAARRAPLLLQETLQADRPTVWRGIMANINPNSRYAQVRNVTRAIRYFSPDTGKTDTVGLLVISLSDSIMAEYLARAPLPSGQQLMLLDRTGRVVLHSEPKQLGQALAPGLLDLLRQGTPSQRLMLDGVPTIMDALRVEYTGGHVVMLTPMHMVTGRVDRLTTATLLVMALCLLAVGALTWHYARGVVTPVRAVSMGFTALHRHPDVAQQPLPVPATEDEIAQLVQGYNEHLLTLQAQKQASVDLQLARQAAESASRAKSELLANMSHEIRTPMNAILGLIKLMQSTPLDARQKDYLEKTDGAANSLLGLINDILDFSKIEAGKMTLDPRPFSLQRLLDALSVVLAANLRNKPVEIRFEVAPDVPAYLMGDDMRLQQVLINLAGNAIKFTDAGEVVVAVRALSQNAHEAELAFSVRDTGIGIAPEQQSRIFGHFSQAESSTTRRFGGTGLGLAISKRIVELMGGELNLQSTLGQGSTFTFTVRLPKAEPPREAPSTASTTASDAKPQRLQGLRILLVEDNKINQMVADGLLSGEGAKVTLAANGQLGVDAVLNHPGAFDVVLMDVQMPVMDGYEATRTLRQHPECAQLPIIAMTANAMAEDRTACLAAGMNDHVGKPFNLNQLVQMLLRVTSRTAEEKGA